MALPYRSGATKAVVTTYRYQAYGISWNEEFGTALGGHFHDKLHLTIDGAANNRTHIPTQEVRDLKDGEGELAIVTVIIERPYIEKSDGHP